MIELIHGDCLAHLDHLASLKIDAVVSDPPYGVSLKTNNTRFSRKGVSGKGMDYRPVHGDDKPFDPSPWLKYKRCVLWGANFYSNKLPFGGWLAWIKKPVNGIGKFMGDWEAAWISTTKANYLVHHLWNGCVRETEKGEHYHPTQKPVEVMRFCLQKLRLEPGMTVLDPYMGSGSTGVAAMELGLNFVGIEIDSDYFKIATDRIESARQKFNSKDLDLCNTN